MSKQSPEISATLNLKTGNPAIIACDVLVIATSTDEKFSVLGDALTKATKAKIRTALLAVGATGKVDEVIRIPSMGMVAAPKIVAVGIGSAVKIDSIEVLQHQLKIAAGNATRSLIGQKRIVIAFPTFLDHEFEIGLILEGAGLGLYTFSRHRSATLKKQVNTTISAVTPKITSAHKQSLERAKHIVTAVHFARDLINTSPLHLPPAQMAQAASDLLAETSVQVEVLDEKALSKGGYGGILAVGQGSSRPPRLIRMEYRTTQPAVHIVLIGKGITFDTGGISLKPPANMHEMKADMSGAAAVIATMYAVQALQIPVNVTAYAACAENMPGGQAQRPGDVITIYGGRTVEVLNTDAEGRLVLADALVRASEDNPAAIIDIATLTGAAVLALGHRTAGILGDERARRAVLEASEVSGENFWPMPMPAELRAPLDSGVADIANIGIREGGMLSAAWFLKEFVPSHVVWGHMDIAGPAYNAQAPYGYVPKGGVGFGVQTFIAMLEAVGESRSELAH